MRVAVMYGFPVVNLAPSEERTVKALTSALFTGQRLICCAQIDEERGRFWVKRSRRPKTDTRNVFAYSRRATKRSRKWRTVVKWPAQYGRRARTRSYLPSSVVYLPVDPLEFVLLTDYKCDTHRQFTNTVRADFFAPSRLGNGLSFRVAKDEIALTVRNVGDVTVRFSAAVHGLQITNGLTRTDFIGTQEDPS